MEFTPGSILTVVVGASLALIVITAVLKSIRIVPQKHEYIVERLGKYNKTMGAGFHILVPFIDRVAYRRSLKEEALDVAEQTCITKDNISVGVDGILYMQVVDSAKSCYGISDFKFAVIQLAQTTMRSVFGTIDLDKTFEEREKINVQVVQAVDQASDPWGVKVIRYEVKNIMPPASIKEAMEKQMKAEREKRAVIAESEGKKTAAINAAEGEKAAAIARSEGEMQKRINEATGKSKEIELVAVATATGIAKVATEIQKEGGDKAVNLRVAEQYIKEFGNLAKANNTMIIPTNLSDIAGVVAGAMKVVAETKKTA